MKTGIRHMNKDRRLPAATSGPRGVARPAPGFRGPTELGGPSLRQGSTDVSVPPPGAVRLQVGAADDGYEHEADRLAIRIVDEMSAPGASCLPAENVTRMRHPVRDQTEDREGASLSDLTANSKGERLPEPLRRAAERVLGHDLAAVRIHAGPVARNLTAAIGADAFASSNHVFFRHPLAAGSPSHAALLAHEVTHTVQQSGSAPAVPVAQRGFLSRFRRKSNTPAHDSEDRQPLLFEEPTYPSLDEVLAEHGADRQTPAVVLNAKYRAAVMRAEENAGAIAPPPAVSEVSKEHIRDLPVTAGRVQGESGLTGMLDLETNTAHAKGFLAAPGRGAAHQQQAVEYHNLQATTTAEMDALKKPEGFVGPVNSAEFPFENKAGFSVGHKSEDGLHVRFGGNTFNLPSFGDHLLPRAERVKVMRSLAQSGQPVRYGYSDAEVTTVLEQHITRDEAELTAALVNQESVLPAGVSVDRLKPPPTVSASPENQRRIASGIKKFKRRK